MNWRLMAGGVLVAGLVAALVFALNTGGGDVAPTTTIGVLPTSTTTALPTTTVAPTTVVPTTTMPPTTTTTDPDAPFTAADIDVVSDEVPVLDLTMSELTDAEFERILEIHLEFHRWLGLHPELITEEILEMVAVRDSAYWDNRVKSWNNNIEKNVRIDPGTIDFVSMTPLLNGIPTSDDIPADSTLVELVTSAIRINDFVIYDSTTGDVVLTEPASGNLLEGRAVLLLQPDGRWLASVLGA